MPEIKQEVLKTLRSDTLRNIHLGKKRTHTFKVDFSDINEEFIGTFTVHYPSQMERLQIGVTKSALLGGNLEVDVMTDNIAHIISTLDVVLDSKPDWFDVHDPDISYDMLEAIYQEYINWVGSFRRSLEKIPNTGDSTN